MKTCLCNNLQLDGSCCYKSFHNINFKPVPCLKEECAGWGEKVSGNVSGEAKSENTNEQLTDDLENLQDKMHKIVTWINAYPIKIFPEPDFKLAHKVLKQHGMTLDAISASNMRHVLKGIKAIIL